ncbi:MAG: hypothetical protein FWG64_12285 [Firmicutes bacterium]|nr:hypothetical protein [Bacillota bacterium]
MATSTYDKTIVLSPEAAERLADILDRPAVPLSEGADERLEESLRRGKEWIKNFSKQSA